MSRLTIYNLIETALPYPYVGYTGRGKVTCLFEFGALEQRLLRVRWGKTQSKMECEMEWTNVLRRILVMVAHAMSPCLYCARSRLPGRQSIISWVNISWETSAV